MSNSNTALTYLSRFKFLETIPYVEALRRSDDGECFICQEPYTLLNHTQKPGTLNHLPVRLPCGHVLGFQCLTHWILSKSFNHRCGLCRAEIISKPAEDKVQRPDTLAHDLMELVITLRGGVTSMNRDTILYTFLALLGRRNSADTTPLERNRTMVLCEAFLHAFASENPARRFERFPPTREVVVEVARIVPVERVREVERVVEVERLVQRAPAKPKPGRVTILKALIFSIILSLFSVMVALRYIYYSAVTHSQIINLDKQSDQIALINARGSLVVIDLALQETLFYHVPNFAHGLSVVGLLLLVTTLFWGTRPGL